MKNEPSNVAKVWDVLLTNGLPHGLSTSFEANTQWHCLRPLEMPAAWADKEDRQISLEAHVRESIAWQVRVNREERGLTQKQLATATATGQSAISKVEDPDGGDVRLSTLLKLAHGFDCALQVRFVPYSEFWSFVAAPRSDRLIAPSYEAECSPMVRPFAAQTLAVE